MYHYVLKISNNKWFVGRVSSIAAVPADNPWKNKSVELASIFPCRCTTDAVTIKFMRKYGIRNVRGGTYSEAHLSPSQYAEIAIQLESRYF